MRIESDSDYFMSMKSDTKLPKLEMQTIHVSPKCFKITIVITIVGAFSLLWYMNDKTLSSFGAQKIGESFSSSRKSGHIVKFSNGIIKYNDVRRACYNQKDPKNIEDLKKFVTLLSKQRHVKQRHVLICQQQYKLFNDIYRIRIKYTTIQISNSFMLKVKKWLHDNQDMIELTRNQSVIFVDNKYTSESVVFNPVRANRPGTGAGNTLNYIKELVASSSKSCDFCSYVNNTATELFGRMESKHGVIVSNTFKIEKYHGLALLRSHDPLKFNQMQFIDCMHLIRKWFKRVNSLTPGNLYRFMYWDIFPKASASQVHPHLHLMSGDESYYMHWNQLFRAATSYSKTHQHANYWNSLLQIHTSLGLSVSFGDASVIAYITPIKDYEVIVMAATPSLDFFRLAYFTYRAFIDDLQQYAISTGYVFPRDHADKRYGDELPMMLRIVSRGAADAPRGDVSSFDLFGTPNVNKDPFKLIVKLRASIERQSKEEFKFQEWKEL